MVEPPHSMRIAQRLLAIWLISLLLVLLDTTSEIGRLWNLDFLGKGYASEWNVLAPFAVCQRLGQKEGLVTTHSEASTSGQLQKKAQEVAASYYTFYPSMRITSAASHSTLSNISCVPPFLGTHPSFSPFVHFIWTLLPQNHPRCKPVVATGLSMSCCL